MNKHSFYDRQIILRTKGNIPLSVKDLTKSSLFKVVIEKFIESLKEMDSPLLSLFGGKPDSDTIILLFQELSNKDVKQINTAQFGQLVKDTYQLSQFLEQLYNFWRTYERFLVCYVDENIMSHRSFNNLVEKMNALVLDLYRDLGEHITGSSLNVYRQIPAACQVGLIVTKDSNALPQSYRFLGDIHVIKQVVIEPPLIIDPPTNTRKGQFQLIDKNPILGLKLDSEEWLCYPAKVGSLLIFIYFHNKFIGLGTAIANLFDLESDITKKPDGIYLYGVPDDQLEAYGALPTVYHEDKENDLFVGVVPLSDQFGYFGYIKKMVLTMHNSIMMKRNRLPIHGAMVSISLKNGKTANVVIVGDSGAGKSESLEAFRILSGKHLRDMKIIFDDMGSLEISKSGVLAYGTETGAFVRLDDLQPGYAFGNIDRSIIMSPQKINARAVLPITTMEEVLRGYKVDMILYANNYEQVDDDNPFIEKFESSSDAMKIFCKGSRMAKGTTSEKGLVHTYYANIFGPVQMKPVHDILAKKFFTAFFEQNLFVGQIRTRLGVEGFETKGPESAAEALFKVIGEK